METLLAFVVGALYAGAIYLLLRRSLVKLLLGLALLSHAANLLIFTAAGITRGRPPLIDEGAQTLTPPYADPLPQALVLTAIVISFAVLAFGLVLFHRTYQELGTDDLDDLREHGHVSALVVLPFLVPLATGALGLAAWRWRRVQRWLSVAGALLHCAVAVALLERVSGRGIQTALIGGWPAPYGIVIVADLFAAMLVMVAAVIGLAVTLYSLASMDPGREQFGYYPLLQILVGGVCGAFLSGDIFNLYVWFEVMLIASFVLLALGGERQQIEGSIKYVTLNLMSSALFLSAVGILYGKTGTLNLAELGGRLAAIEQTNLVTTIAMLFLVAFGIKVAVFPLFFWLPASYHTPPVAVSAVLAGLLTKVGVYSMIWVFTLVFTGDVAYTHSVILAVAGLTMVSGVLGAAAQSDFRRILAFHIVSQIGYMLMGLGLYSELALTGSVFYIVHHIVVKTNLFLVSGIAARFGGSFDLGRLGGLYRDRPALALLFLVPALSLAGLPPLSGFFAKLLLVRAGLELGRYAIVATALAVSLLTLYSMTKIWHEAFWKERPPAPAVAPARGSTALYFVPVVGLAAVTLAIGLRPQPLLGLAERAASELLTPEVYVGAVLGGRR